MRILVSTCDKSDHLLGGFAVQWNRYWGIPVDVVGFRTPVGLPENFTFHSMEPVETRSWSANIRGFLQRVEWNHFVFMFEDYWLREQVDTSEVARLEGLISTADKVDLSRNTHHFEHVEIGDGMVEAVPFAHYRASTQPAIWRREHMLGLLQGDMNPWEFEIRYRPEVTRGRIIGTRDQVVKFANVHYKGAPDEHMIQSLSPEDLAQLRQLNLLPTCQSASQS